MRKIFVFILFSVVLTSCNKEKKAEKPESFPVTEIIAIDTLGFVDYVAEIKAKQNVEIRARVSGYLEKIYIDEGKYVKQGQLLFTINNGEYKEELAKAKAVYRSALADANAAELEVNNIKQLVEKNIVSKTELALAKNKLESMNARVEEALAHQTSVAHKLSYTSIKAPFDGLVNRIPHKIGSLIEEGTLLTSISEDDEVLVYFDVSEKEYLTYANSLKNDTITTKTVSLILANGKEHSTKGKIETIEGEIEEKTGNIAFRARFNNKDKVLKHGASGKIRLEKKYPKALLIPQKSTFDLQERLYVYVIDKDDKVRSRNIIAKNRIPHFFIVDKGLQVGDRILYEGIQSVRDDKIITPQMISMREVLKEFQTE